jgi:hypothetical protein
MATVDKVLAGFEVTIDNVIPTLAAAFNQANIAEKDLKAGIEIEVGFLNKDASLPSTKLHLSLEAAISNRIATEFPEYRFDELISVEPCTFVFEVKTPPFAVKDAAKMLAFGQRLEQIVIQEAQKYQLIRLPFSVVPHLKGEQILKHLIEGSADSPQRGERTRQIVTAMEYAFEKGNATWGFGAVSSQLTCGTKDAKSHVRLQRLTAATASLRFAVTDNAPPIIFGDDAPLKESPVQQIRHRIGRWRQVAQDAFHHESTELFFARWLKHHFDKPLLTIVEPDGSYKPNLNGYAPTYLDLLRDKPQIYGQLLTAQGAWKENWGHCKLQTIISEPLMEKAGAEAISLAALFPSLLLEVRDAGVGNATGAPMVLFMQLPMSFDEVFQDYLIDILKGKYGIDLNDGEGLEQAFQVIELNAEAARKREYLYGSNYTLHAPFGANGHTLQDLMIDISAQLRASHIRMETHLEHLSEVWQELQTTGMTDAQFYREVFATPQACKAFITSCNQNIFLNSDMTTMYHHYKNGELPKLAAIPVPLAPAKWETSMVKKASEVLLA